MTAKSAADGVADGVAGGAASEVGRRSGRRGAHYWQGDRQRLAPDFEIDPASWWLYRPRSLTALVGGLVSLAYLAFYQSHKNETNEVIWGLGAAFGAFVVYGAMHFRDGPFIRPHPVVWRVVSAVCVAYFVILVFLLFQNVDTVRKQWLPALDSTLGKPLKEKDYGGTCALYTLDTEGCEESWRHCFSLAPLTDKVWDEFMLAHFLGWFGKAIIMRSWVCAFMSGILFELFELTFDNWLPNFTECWWDHIILDLFGCNLGGIIAGFYVCHFFQMKKYSWHGISTMDGRRAKLKRVMGQFTPVAVEKAPGLREAKGLFTAFIVALSVAVVDLSSFNLKALLWLKPPHKFNIIRLVIWWLLGNLAIREFYSYVSDASITRFGQHSWLSCACLLLEIAVCWRWSKEEKQFKEPFAPYVIESWILGGTAFLLCAIIVYAPICEPIRQRLRPVRKYFHQKVFICG